MEQGHLVAFGPFRFDLPTARLWRGEREIPLQARPRAVLRYLVEHPGRLIPREEFAQHVWAGTHVSKAALRGRIWDVRQALGDQAALPQYIETVGQQGYRFVAQVVAPGAEGPTASTSPFVGRQAELTHLQAALAQAQRGQSQLVFVIGEAGVGKTTLVSQFLAHLHATGPVWVGQGQCIEQAGSGEAYLPLLEALGRLGCAPGGDRLRAALRRAAPMWLVHLPLLLEDSARETLQRQVQGASRARMLRELVEALTLVTAEHSLVLVLEDLQWSDASTVAFLASVARRVDRLRLLVVGTYRPAEVIARGHALRQTTQELAAHRLCQNLRLELLTVVEVQAYVTQRLGASPATAVLGELIHRWTDGNALFMVHVLDYLLQHGLLGQDGGQWRLRSDVTTLAGVLPDSLQALIGKQLEALAPEAQQCLAVASVAGGQQFTAAEVAAGLQCPVAAVEGVCDGLSQRSQFIAAQAVVEWPDGTVTGQYGFGHAVYQVVLYARLGQAQRVRLHRWLGERLERGYGQRAREIASTLAWHFAQGQDARRAVQYQGYAAEQALLRSAYPEALACCQEGLALLATLPETPERLAQELRVRTSLSAILSATHGFVSPELEQNLQRAQTLYQEMEAMVEFVPTLVALTRLAMMRADREATEALMAHERRFLAHVHEAAALVQLHAQLGTAETFRGAYARAQEHQAHALRMYDLTAHQAHVLTYTGDPRAVALAMSGWCLWLAGWPTQAADAAERALEHAEALKHPFILATILFLVVHVWQFRGAFGVAGALAQRLVALAGTRGFGMLEAFGLMTQGGVLIQQGDLATGLAQLTRGLTQYQASGAQVLVPFFLAFQAVAHLRGDRGEDGVRVIEAALRLTATNFDRFWEAELHRLRGELVLVQGGTTPSAHDTGAEDAVGCFQRALAIARQQGAKALELRAAMSLSRLWQQQGKWDEAHELLAPTYGWFTEGFDTADLQEAKAWLEELTGSVRGTRPAPP